MKVKSKNGIKLDIQPKNKLSIMDWYWAWEQTQIIKHQDVHINTEGWKFTYGSIEEAK